MSPTFRGEKHRRVRGLRIKTMRETRGMHRASKGIMLVSISRCIEIIPFAFSALQPEIRQK